MIGIEMYTKNPGFMKSNFKQFLLPIIIKMKTKINLNFKTLGHNLNENLIVFYKLLNVPAYLQ